MRNTKHVPGNHTLMPIIIEILKDYQGTLNFSQIVYMIMFKYDLPPKLLKKARKEISFAGTYLRKIGALASDTKRGKWTLSKEYLEMDTSRVKEITYKKYAELLNKK